MLSNNTESANQAQANDVIKQCPYRLGFHIIPSSGWMNDPNGLVFHDGLYHAFFQYHPYSSVWGPMHWGHVTSKDMVHWQRQPVALAPGEEGISFSGSAVSDNGELHLFYTGHHWTKQENDWQNFKQTQCLATSQDGVSFEKKGIVIADSPLSHIQDFRDPKVWKEDGKWHLILGAQDNGTGQVLYYQGQNPEQWEYQGVLVEATEAEGYMWECPDLFKLGSKHVLAASPQGLPKHGYHNLSEYQCGYFVGEFDGQSFSHSGFTEFDVGHDFYACQTFETPDGRRVMQAWMGLPATLMETQDNGWAGALSLPRELTLDEQQRVIQKPIKELEGLRRAELLSLQNSEIEAGHHKLDVQGELLEIKLSFCLQERTAERFGILLRCGENREQTMIGYDAMAKRIYLDRNLSGHVQGVRSTAHDGSDHVELHIFLDRSCVEIFSDTAYQTITSRIYPSESSTKVNIFSENGKVKLKSLNIWQLKDIWHP